MSRVTLRERFFPLHQPVDVDRFLGRFPWSVVFKAGTSDKTFDAWLVARNALEPRADVAVGFIRLPEDRAASDRVSARSGVAHRSPQFVLFHDETFDVLNSLFENQWGRDLKAARLVALEFQGQLAGRLKPLKARAARMLELLRDR